MCLKVCLNQLNSGYINCLKLETIFVNSVFTQDLLFQVVITLIITSYHVFSAFSSTVFALSWVRAEVVDFGFSSFLSVDQTKTFIIQTIIVNGLKEISEAFFHSIIFVEAFWQSSCQSSSAGFNNIWIAADSSSSNFENAFVMLFIGSDSSFW